MLHVVCIHYLKLTSFKILFTLYIKYSVALKTILIEVLLHRIIISTVFLGKLSKFAFFNDNDLFRWFQIYKIEKTTFLIKFPS